MLRNNNNNNNNEINMCIHRFGRNKDGVGEGIVEVDHKESKSVHMYVYKCSSDDPACFSWNTYRFLLERGEGAPGFLQ